MTALDYVPIRLSALRGKRQLTFDLYVLVAEKFILYMRQGDSSEAERLDRLHSKGQKKLYILRDQEETYKKFLRQKIEAAYDSTLAAPMNERAAIIQGAQQAMVENLMAAPDDSQVFEATLEGTRRFIEFITNENSALTEILQIPNSDCSPAHHGINVATLAIALCKRLKVVDRTLLTNLALGCMIHDIEFFSSGLPLEKNYETLKGDERATYKKMPQLSFERLKSYPFYEPLTLMVVGQSEECIDGSGFPEGLQEDEMDPMVTLASMCNAFDRYVSINKIPPKEALKTILIERMGRHPLKYFQALQDALKDDGAV